MKFWTIIISYKTILSYCLNCTKNTESKNLRDAKRNKRRLILLLKCVMCKKSRFIKKEEAIGLLSNLEVRTSLSKIPILDGILL